MKAHPHLGIVKDKACPHYYSWHEIFANDVANGGYGCDYLVIIPPAVVNNASNAPQVPVHNLLHPSMNLVTHSASTSSIPSNNGGSYVPHFNKGSPLQNSQSQSPTLVNEETQDTSQGPLIPSDVNQNLAAEVNHPSPAMLLKEIVRSENATTLLWSWLLLWRGCGKGLLSQWIVLLRGWGTRLMIV